MKETLRLLVPTGIHLLEMDQILLENRPIFLPGMLERIDAVEPAKDKMDAAFEFSTKMNLPYYCFHDVDVVDYGNDVLENERRLQAITAYAERRNKRPAE